MTRHVVHHARTVVHLRGCTRRRALGSGRLRSVTGGQGAYTIEFSHYAAVPPQTQSQLASQFKLDREED